MMSKKHKSKKKKNVQAAAMVAAPLDSGQWRLQMEAHCAAAEWQEALSLALRIRHCTETVESDSRLCSKVAEAALRDMMENNKENRFRKVVASIREQYPEWIQEWPLGLQVAAHGVPDLDVQLQCGEFADRLRKEIWNPVEMAWSDHPALRQDGEHLLNAWKQVERRDFVAARKSLGHIGRQSPLIDWRLLLQVMMAAHLQDESGALAAFQRIHSQSPARHVAAAIMRTANPDPDRPALAALESQFRPPTLRTMIEDLVSRVVQTSGDPAIDRVLDAVRILHTAGKSEWATAIPVAFGDLFDEGDGSMIDELMDRLPGIDRRLVDRCRIRASSDVDHDLTYLSMRLKAVDYVIFRYGKEYSAHERAILGLILCRTIKKCFSAGPAVWISEDPKMIGELIDPAFLIEVARNSLACWPDLDELYELWHWAESLSDPSPCEALTSWSRHDPDNVEVLIRCIDELLENRRYKRAEAALSRLKQFPGERRQYAERFERCVWQRCVDACETNQPAILRALLRQADEMADETLWMVRLADQIMTQRDGSLSAIFDSMDGSPHNFWDFLLRAVDLQAGERIPDFLKERTAWLEQYAAELASRWLEQSKLYAQFMPDYVQVPDSGGLMHRILKKLQNPQQQFDIIWAMFQTYFDEGGRDEIDEGEEWLDTLVPSAMLLVKQEKTKWQAAGLGLAGCFVMDRYLEEEDGRARSTSRQAMNILFSTMRNHACRGPEVDQIWKFISEQGLLDDITIHEMDDIGVQAVVYSVKNSKVINGLIAKLKRCSYSRPVFKKPAKPKPRAKQAKDTPPAQANQLDFFDLGNSNE